jgi:hypothetical protein
MVPNRALASSNERCDRTPAPWLPFFFGFRVDGDDVELPKPSEFNATPLIDVELTLNRQLADHRISPVEHGCPWPGDHHKQQAKWWGYWNWRSGGGEMVMLWR